MVERPLAERPLQLLLLEDDTVDQLAVARALQPIAPQARLTTVNDCAALLRQLERAPPPDLLLLDYQLPDGDGLTLLQQIRGRGIALPVVMLTGHGDERLAVKALQSGACDYLPKSSLTPDQLQQVLSVALSSRCRRCIDSAVAAQAQQRLALLTPRERQVLAGLAAGQSNKQLAAELGISCRTVETYRARVMEKSGAGSLAELVILARYA